MRVDKEGIIKIAIDQGVMPLFYEGNYEKCIGMIKAMYRAGFRLIEFLNRGPAAQENFRRLKLETKTDCPGLILGAGTIRSPEDAHTYAALGADFLVSPMFDPWLASLSEELNILWIPGCMSPTEIHMAWKQGIRLVKIFPAFSLGTGFMSAVKEVYPEMLLMPSGGVEPSEENLNAWFKSGVSLVAMGSKLFTKEIKQNSDFELLESSGKKLVDIIKKIRSASNEVN